MSRCFVAVMSQPFAGLVCLVGLKKGDTPTDSDFIARKVLSSRLFEDPDSGASWKKNVVDVCGEVLCVSQFTLYGRVKSAKPDFVHAMPPGEVRAAALTLCIICGALPVVPLACRAERVHAYACAAAISTLYKTSGMTELHSEQCCDTSLPVIQHSSQALSKFPYFTLL
jgi:D-Tyr-tRNA(Tyr) deacylase